MANRILDKYGGELRGNELSIFWSENGENWAATDMCNAQVYSNVLDRKDGLSPEQAVKFAEYKIKLYEAFKADALKKLSEQNELEAALADESARLAATEAPISLSLTQTESGYDVVYAKTGGELPKHSDSYSGIPSEQGQSNWIDWYMATR